MRKSPNEMSLSERKIDLTFRLYVDPADHDYLAARWAYSNGLFHVFYWCAAQACEKYLKASLLLQDRPAHAYKHDLVALFQEARSCDPQGIMPDLLELPVTSAMGQDLWQGKTSALYIEYLATYGSPDNRYAFYGTFVNGPVLYALDIMCCAFRRLMRTTNITGDDLFARQSAGLMPHERIIEDQEWMLDPLLLLECLYCQRYPAGQSRTTRYAFSNMNFAFFHTHSDDEQTFGGQHFHGSPLHNHLVRLGKLDASPLNLECIEQLRAWADANIYMSGEVRAQLGLPKRVRRSD